MDKDANLGKKGKEEPSHTWVGVRGEISAYQKEDLQEQKIEGQLTEIKLLFFFFFFLYFNPACKISLY